MIVPCKNLLCSLSLRGTIEWPRVSPLSTPSHSTVEPSLLLPPSPPFVLLIGARSRGRIERSSSSLGDGSFWKIDGVALFRLLRGLGIDAGSAQISKNERFWMIWIMKLFSTLSFLKICIKNLSLRNTNYIRRFSTREMRDVRCHVHKQSLTTNHRFLKSVTTYIQSVRTKQRTSIPCV